MIANNIKNEQWILLLEIAALYRKYETGDKNEFIKNIQTIKKSQTNYLEDAWQKGAAKIKHDDIIKDAKSLSPSDHQICKEKASIILRENKDIKTFLFSKFDPKEFKLDDENKIRRIRNIVAEKHLEDLIEKYKVAVANEKTKLTNKFKIYTYAVNFAFLGISIFGLTPLYQEYYKKKQEAIEWRQSGIANSPTVCLTQTGDRYHNCYHYSGRNYEISLFEAVIDKHKTPCGTCHPPIIDFGEEPKSNYPNPFLISLFPIGLGIWGNGYMQRKKKEKINSSF